MTDIREDVRKRYADAALSVSDGCCGDSCGDEAGFGSQLYTKDELAEVPTEAGLASLGCGNPTMVAELATGETVLGPTGMAYGVDMTDEMLDLARKNQAEAGIENVEFLRGYIEDVPLPDGSVDVIISNCVINLSADKPAVFAEMHRLLRPGGRIGISDVVSEDRLTPAERAERGSYVGCIAGALSISEYTDGLAAVGFEAVEVVPTHEVGDGMHSAIIRAVKKSN